MNFRPPTRPAGGLLDMTPFVDTIFNLLIFFALSMNFLADPGITVDLPDASAKEAARKGGDLDVAITRKGEVRLDGAPVALANLRAALGEAAATGDRPQVLLRADRSVPHGLVVAVMDAAKSAGLTRIAILTRPGEPPPPILPLEEGGDSTP